MPSHSRLLAAVLCAVAATAGAVPLTPVGTWRVIGDDSGEAEALVAISERDGQLEGRVVKLFARPGVAPDAVCELCPGERRNQPVEGLTILSGMRRDGDEYVGGEILDPDSGAIYRCKMKLSADSRRLTVRGYLGVALFGRTQTWLRE
jgi:uncharacterized protein (DUF2147 family)